ncbi:MAG: glycosyltransferase, partial [Acidimicrobiia bacterium]
VPDPGPFEPAVLASLRSELGIADDAIVAVVVAIMRPGKGHDVLVDALPHISDDRVVFLVVGDGPDSERLRARVEDIDRVVFAGFRDDVGKILAAADFVVHPSLGDALPTALVHALAAGRPVVASAVGGIPEIVPAGAGVLVAPGDPQALAGAIDRVAADVDQRRLMGKRARERYDEEFSAEDWADRLRTLYDEVLRDHR